MMSRQLPPLQWLHTYLSVINCGSFSAAAVELNMTQAAVSKQIRLLEHRFGEALFERHARGVTPTGAGIAILERVNSAFHLLQGVEQDLQCGTRVHLRCDITYADAVIASRLHRLPSEPHGLSLSITSFVWPDLSQMTYHDLHVLPDNGDLPGFERMPLGTEFSIMVAHPATRELWRNSPEKTHLLVRVGQESAWDQWLDDTDKHTQVKRRSAARLIADSSLICKRAALAGQGIALMRYSQICNELEHGTLVRVDDFQSQLASENYALYAPHGTERDLARQAVYDWILACHADVQKSAEEALKR